ncbi:MAG TPA: hypothetical protein VMJ64_03735 [Anaerolineales bacterium]|nr:hypothetical protein [Anaerolineales bacterium]
MRRAELFWGPLLILLGVLFFLDQMGYLPGGALSWFLPFLVMAAGAWILIGGLQARKMSFETSEQFSVPLQEAREASLVIHHGVGEIRLQAGANPGDFLTGVSGPGMDKKIRLNDGKLEVEIDAGPNFVPFIGPDSGLWEYRLNEDVPVSIKVEAGASRLDFDLSDLRVTHFSFEGGASSVNLKLPARVENALIDLEAGAASIDVQVPDGVALRFRNKSTGSLDVDEARFPRRETGLYQSADYAAAQYHAEVNVDGGATSIRVH